MAVLEGETKAMTQRDIEEAIKVLREALLTLSSMHAEASGVTVFAGTEAAAPALESLSTIESRIGELEEALRKAIRWHRLDGYPHGNAMTTEQENAVCPICHARNALATSNQTTEEPE